MKVHPIKLIILEYHRNTGINFEYQDDYHLFENEFLYENYVNSHSGQKGVPDVFFNVNKRIQGVSSFENVMVRLERELQSLLNQDAYFTIEPKISINNNEIHISAKIARLGSKSINDILVKSVIVERIDNEYLKRVVRQTQYSSVISQFTYGDVKEISFDPVTIGDEWGSNLTVIYIITSEDELNMYQSIEVGIND